MTKRQLDTKQQHKTNIQTDTKTNRHIERQMDWPESLSLDDSRRYKWWTNTQTNKQKNYLKDWQTDRHKMTKRQTDK
jgi:hypothetical protein